MYIPETEYHSYHNQKNKTKCMWVAAKCLWWWSMCLTLLSMQCTTDDDIQPSRTSTKPRYCCSTWHGLMLALNFLTSSCLVLNQLSFVYLTSVYMYIYVHGQLNIKFHHIHAGGRINEHSRFVECILVNPRLSQVMPQIPNTHCENIKYQIGC